MAPFLLVSSSIVIVSHWAYRHFVVLWRVGGDDVFRLVPIHNTIARFSQILPRYLENTLSVGYGVSKHPCFCFQRRYWNEVRCDFSPLSLSLSLMLV